jgi:Helix-turn-helix of insertion element transposase
MSSSDGPDAKFERKSEKRWTKEQLDKDTRLDEHQVGFILWCEQYYMLHSKLPEYEITTEHITITEVQWNEYWRLPQIREALVSKGIPLLLPQGVDATPESVTAPILTGRQLQLLNILLDTNDTRPDHKKCSDLGVSNQEYQAWLNDPVFSSYYNARADKLLKNSSADADRALLDNIRMGDHRSIEYYNEMTGRYRKQDPQVVNFTLLVNQIIDILAAELTPDQANKIAGRILTSVQASGIPLGMPAPVGNTVIVDALPSSPGAKDGLGF